MVVLTTAILVLLGSVHQSASSRPQPYFINVGGVLSTRHSERHFHNTVTQLNIANHEASDNVTYNATSIKMDPNPIRTALNVCKYLIAQRVYTVIVSHLFAEDLSPAAVSFTSGFYHIPVIGISSRDTAFSDKNIHGSFLRTVPPYAHQADVWVELIKVLLFYKEVKFIHSSDTDGRALLGRFRTVTQNMYDEGKTKIVIDDVIEFEPGLDNFTDQLRKIKKSQARVFLVYAGMEDATVIFRDAELENMTSGGYAYIVTEQALEASNVPAGTLGLRLVNGTNELAHIQDSISVLVSALQNLNQTAPITEAPNDCNNSESIWESGKTLFDNIKKQVMDNGATGKVAFDVNGDRIYAEYDVINVQMNLRRVTVGRYFYNSSEDRMQLLLNETGMVWSGGSENDSGAPRNLRVLTIEEKPFVYKREKLEDEENCLTGEVFCPHFNITDDTYGQYCCRGFCIDLLEGLAKSGNFKYKLFLSTDGQFGSYEIKPNSGGKKEWSGMIGDLVNDRADMIVAPLTINPERAEVIDFSKPFKYQGITILEKMPSRSSTLVSFLQPFSNALWILVVVSVHIVALVLYLLDRFSPFGQFKLAFNDGTEENALNLSSALWLTWGVLLNSGIGEGSPRSLSARVLGMVWAGFAMIIVASYTANLAALLVLERPKTKLSGINDARLRNSVGNLSCATVRGSAVEAYFQRQAELAGMYRAMEANNYPTVEEAIQDVKLGKLMAFIWDNSRLEYEAARDCELTTSGELFGRSGYAVGLRKTSAWTDPITLAILEMHESGFIEKLDNEWILQRETEHCEQSEKSSNTLGLKNMAGVFILVAVGIVGGFELIIIEMVYKKHQIRKQRRNKLARHAIDKWRMGIEKRKMLRTSIAAQRHLKASDTTNSPAVRLSVDALIRRRPEATTEVYPESRCMWPQQQQPSLWD